MDSCSADVMVRAMRSTATSSRVLRAAVHLALALVAVRIWNLLLFKEHLDRPGLVATWLTVGFVLVMLSRGVARRTSPHQRSRLQKRWAAIEGPDLAFVAIFFLLLFLFHWGFQRAASDGREYFVQVRSLVMDGDLDFANENAVFGVRGTAGIYAFGAPLLWTPFFVAAHLTIGVWNVLGAGLAANGFANPYQRAIGLGTLIYGFIALVLIYRLLSHYFSRRLAALSTLTIAGGSFILWYLVVDNSMSHGASMFAVTLFVYLWHENRDDDSLRRWALLGATAGLMAMVRWQNILFVVFPLAEELARLRHHRGERFGERLKDAVARYGVFGAVFLFASLPQLIFWKVVSGRWIAPPASSHSVAWTEPQIADVLFSSDRGLFAWTPLLLLAVLGLPLFLRRDRLFTVAMALAFAGQVYINSLVEQGGHGFGARKFAGCALIFAIGLAALLEWMRDRPRLTVGLLMGALVLLNTFFMLDMNRSRLPATGSITFDEMLGSVTSKVGNPFTLPMAAFVAWRYDADLTLYERLGQQTFNNVHIDLGSPTDARFLVRGWSEREAAPGLDYRWSLGSASSFVVRLKEGVDYRLEVRCAPFPHPHEERQVIEVWVNGEFADRLVLGAAMDTYRARLSADLMRTGYNEIVLRYGYAASPLALGISSDPRELAVQFDTLSLIREG